MEVNMGYRTVFKEAFNVVGIRKLTEQPGGVWAIVKNNGSIAKMEEIAGRGKVTLGLCFGFDEKGYNDNMVGFEVAHKIEGYDFYAYPASKWIEVTAEGKISEGILWKTWQYIYEELIDKKIIKQRNVPTIEDYVVWDEVHDCCKIIISVAIC